MAAQANAVRRMSNREDEAEASKNASPSFSSPSTVFKSSISELSSLPLPLPTAALSLPRQWLEFRGSAQFRQRVVIAILSGRPLRITDIRADHRSPGLTDFEACFLRLIDKITNGTAIQINEAGTSLRFKPGTLTGGEGITHECPPSRSVGYFLESLVQLAAFCKHPLNVTLTGITNHNLDTSIDIFRSVTLPLLKHFGIEGAELKIRRRGAAPLGGGEVVFRCPIAQHLKPVTLIDEVFSLQTLELTV